MFNELLQHPGICSFDQIGDFSMQQNMYRICLLEFDWSISDVVSIECNIIWVSSRLFDLFNVFFISSIPINSFGNFQLGRVDYEIEFYQSQCLRDHSDVRTIRRMCIRYFREILDRLYQIVSITTNSIAITSPKLLTISCSIGQHRICATWSI